ncbi:ABC transporter ATP-binding protein [Nocardia arizonensis]|uniref:ABC transporter ATP-binding protein n=1 Tax=Nocardia arizonensis TaxID=1141647 RepID=UPI0009E90D62|nr:ABC transporter ATP-binding protein [Nocardia arizonensis]
MNSTDTLARTPLPATPPPPPRRGGIELSGVRKRYGAQLAVDLPGLSVPAGSFTVIVGPSGCGKSTVLRMICGLETPQEGAIHIDGREVTDIPPGDRDVAMVFQDFALYPHMSVARNVGFGLLLEAKHTRRKQLSRAEIRRRVSDTCDLLGLTGKLDRKPRELSGGERQRVALARAIVRRKPILLLDEPLSNLDAHLRTQARTELIRLHREVEGTFVLVTHDQIEALSMGTHLVVLNRGSLEQDGAPEAVWRRPANLFVAGFLGSPAMNLLPGEAVGAPGRVLGWRPGDAVLVEDPRDTVRSGPTFDATVDVVEFAGDRRVAYCTGADGAWSVEVPATVAPTIGRPIRVHVPDDLVHHFDAKTGHRI